MGSEDPNSATRVSAASTLPNVLFSQCPNVFAFFVVVLSNIDLMVLRHELCRWKQCVAMSKGWPSFPVTAALWKCITLLPSKLIYWPCIIEYLVILISHKRDSLTMLCTMYYIIQY